MHQTTARWFNNNDNENDNSKANDRKVEACGLGFAFTESPPFILSTSRSANPTCSCRNLRS